MKEKNLFYYTIAMLIFFTWGITTYGEASIYKEAPTSKNYYEGFITGYKKSLSDSKISRFAESLLFRFNPDLQHKISLEVNQGMVSVFEIIDTLREKDQIVNMLKTVEGVRGIIDYSILKPVVRSDLDIEYDILAAFLRNPSIYASDLEIQINHGQVTLTGFVANTWEKEEAINEAKGIQGTTEVIEHISIDSQKKRSDRDLQDEMTAMLSSDSYLFDNPITLKLYQGRAMISGAVDNQMEKIRASREISSFAIQGIDNQLRIEEGGVEYNQKRIFDFDDSSIQETVKHLIMLDERIYPQQFDVLVKDMVVTVSGKIEDIYQKRFLEQDILSVPGVSFVKNTLSAESMFRKDADIIRDIRRALQFEPDLLPTNLSLLSESGKVTVKGEVKTYREKELIEKIMTKIAGVEEISNQLQIVDSKVDHIKSAVNDPGVSSDLLQWNINVGNKVFKVYVNRDNETITVRGEAEDWEQKDQVEHVVKMRAPGNFQIINEINIQNS